MGLRPSEELATYAPPFPVLSDHDPESRDTRTGYLPGQVGRRPAHNLAAIDRD